ncbi:hypothetical protein QBC35DRAFT_140170 [Podospora australis]|uniref:Uncharacterized protein n=1 Tax=Podospora australis TaxID=1536484 RepID=A0AAN6WKB7_9PEZI|nr:hypothetical protein QBC35DRAFT_140170 [Podospora australis]
MYLLHSEMIDRIGHQPLFRPRSTPNPNPSPALAITDSGSAPATTSAQTAALIVFGVLLGVVLLALMTWCTCCRGRQGWSRSSSPSNTRHKRVRIIRTVSGSQSQSDQIPSRPISVMSGGLRAPSRSIGPSPVTTGPSTREPSPERYVGGPQREMVQSPPPVMASPAGFFVRQISRPSSSAGPGMGPGPSGIPFRHPNPGSLPGPFPPPGPPDQFISPPNSPPPPARVQAVRMPPPVVYYARNRYPNASVQERQIDIQSPIARRGTPNLNLALRYQVSAEARGGNMQSPLPVGPGYGPPPGNFPNPMAQEPRRTSFDGSDGGSI